jgi:hypothetical protein
LVFEHYRVVLHQRVFIFQEGGGPTSELCKIVHDECLLVGSRLTWLKSNGLIVQDAIPLLLHFEGENGAILRRPATISTLELASGRDTSLDGCPINTGAQAIGFSAFLPVDQVRKVPDKIVHISRTFVGDTKRGEAIQGTHFPNERKRAAFNMLFT